MAIQSDNYPNRSITTVIFQGAGSMIEGPLDLAQTLSRNLGRYDRTNGYLLKCL